MIQRKLLKHWHDPVRVHRLLLLGAHESLPEALPLLKAECAWLYRRV
jgi:hypothetical protein